MVIKSKTFKIYCPKYGNEELNAKVYLPIFAIEQGGIICLNLYKNIPILSLYCPRYLVAL